MSERNYDNLLKALGKTDRQVSQNCSDIDKLNNRLFNEIESLSYDLRKAHIHCQHLDKKIEDILEAIKILNVNQLDLKI